MPLRKPPIVEMWIEFTFEPNPSGTVQPAVQFLQGYAGEYPALEIMKEDRFEFREVSSTELPRVVGRQVRIKHIRAKDEQGLRWMQVTSTQLVCNFVRLGENYPGFRALSQEVAAKLARYVQVCSPVRLRYAAIHYVDVITVPVPSSGQIELRDYFALGIDLPADPFGSQLSFLAQAATQPPDGTGEIDVRLQFEGVIPETKIFRFRMDWHKVCPYHKEVDVEEVTAVLAKAHDSVKKCFRAAFTDCAWKLFEPQE